MLHFKLRGKKNPQKTIKTFEAYRQTKPFPNYFRTSSFYYIRIIVIMIKIKTKVNFVLTQKNLKIYVTLRF